jgi:hypothetical protein
MMEINNALDRLVKMRQDSCSHDERDIIRVEKEYFCTCGLKVR